MHAQVLSHLTMLDSNMLCQKDNKLSNGVRQRTRSIHSLNYILLGCDHQMANANWSFISSIDQRASDEQKNMLNDQIDIAAHCAVICKFPKRDYTNKTLFHCNRFKMCTQIQQKKMLPHFRHLTTHRQTHILPMPNQI